MDYKLTKLLETIAISYKNECKYYLTDIEDIKELVNLLNTLDFQNELLTEKGKELTHKNLQLEEENAELQKQIDKKDKLIEKLLSEYSIVKEKNFELRFDKEREEKQ